MPVNLFSLSSSFIYSSSTIPLLTFFFFFILLSPSFSENPPDSFRDLVLEEKTRLGSTPPSCHNKCNQCHPCMAVQVPSLPNHGRVKQTMEGSGNRESNYKPLGWKCRCEGHLFNP